MVSNGRTVTNARDDDDDRGLVVVIVVLVFDSMLI